MAKGTSTPSRITADIAASAMAIAPQEDRSFAEQINHWARIGMQIERSGSLASRRVLAVARGEAQFHTLDHNERLAAHALIDAQIAERASGQRFGPSARGSGQTTVSLDDDGRLVAIVPQCRRTVFWDNSSDDGPIEIAAYREGPADYPPRWPTWTPEVVADLH